jgi:DNA repair protein RadC
MIEKETELQASEVQIIYKSKIPASKRVQIKSSIDAYRLFWQSWDKNTIEYCEEFRILLLNNKNAALGIAEISKGGVTSTIIDPRIIFGHAIKCHASGIILGHNHPSNNPTPSSTDIEITKKLIEAGKVLNIFVLDHIILCGDGSYISLGDEGRM